MKYNTIGAGEKKPSLTIYADMAQNKMASNEAEITTIRGELEMVEKALKQQTKRCRQLVTEYTRRLQQKEQQYQCEKTLRNDQLAKVLRALIIFEARLKQEQKFIRSQLKEKDQIIEKQNNEIKKLLRNQFCKNCNQYYSPSSNLESLDSSSEYVVTDFYQSSNFESLESNSDIYATVSEKSYDPDRRTKTEHSDDESKSKISESIPVFENDGGETNENWYASASDQDDEEQRDLFKDNPVLECMNQILLRNIDDSISSPPKTPNSERKNPKNSKKVKFSDEETSNLTKENLEDYYETPIQKVPNFYETPQSIYSNDYEQIQKNPEVLKSPDHYYVDLDKKNEDEGEKIRKTKISREPPALPPKPANLVLKYKLKTKNVESESVESEPDYCSISELNLPTQSSKKINVVVEINPPNSQDVISKLENKKKNVESDYDPVETGEAPLHIEKVTIQLAKKTPIKSEPEIPKLPQVSEILIPEEKEEHINTDNYVKNNSQILKNKFEPRRAIVMGTSVSSLISGFNNQMISEIGKKPIFVDFEKKSEKVGETFDLSQNFEEFKLDDCEIEEYSVSDITEEEVTPETIVFEKPEVELNANSVEMLKRKLEQKPTYEHFLECTGLSSKSILTPSRLLSNHKSMLKPKDIKFRSKVSKVERHNQSVIKYWSEPYL